MGNLETSIKNKPVVSLSAINRQYLKEMMTLVSNSKTRSVNGGEKIFLYADLFQDCDVGDGATQIGVTDHWLSIVIRIVFTMS